MLERFNAVGAWQDTDPLGGAINSTADVILQRQPEVKKTISTPAELMAEIAADAATPSASTPQQFVAFATGRSAELERHLRRRHSSATGLATPTYTIANMMADYTQADSFRLRTLGN